MRRRGRRMRWVWLVSLATALPCGGCAHVAAGRILAVGWNAGAGVRPPPAAWSPFDSGFSLEVRAEPEVRLTVWVLEPQRVQLWRRGEAAPPMPEGWTAEAVEQLRVWSDERPPLILRRRRPPAPVRPAGTVIVLQQLTGRARTDYWFWPVAMALADGGYRVIVADLRGQGDSTAPALGYVLGDAEDVGRLIDALTDRGLLVGRLGVFGHSYGAAVAAAAAAADERIAACALSASPMTMRSAIELAAARHRLWRWMTDGQREKTFELISREMGFDIARLDVRAFLEATAAPVLLTHGARDRWVPIGQAFETYLARPERTKFVVYRDGRHLAYLVTRFEDLRPVLVGWFDAHLRGEGTVDYGVQVR